MSQLSQHELRIELSPNRLPETQRVVQTQAQAVML